MISETHQLQIRQYLSSRRLPFDILLEVQDHFENQIEAHLKEPNISFAEAFSLTKISWQKDFKMVRKSLFSFGRVPRIVKAIQVEVSRKMLSKAFAVALCLLLAHLFLAKFIPLESFVLVSVIIFATLGAFILGLILTYIFSSINQRRTRPEKYFYNQLHKIFLAYILLGIFGAFTKLPTNSFVVIYDLGKGLGSYSSALYLAATVSMLFQTSTTFYFYLMLRDRARSIKGIRRYVRPAGSLH